MADIKINCIVYKREQCDREQALEDFKTGMRRMCSNCDVELLFLGLVSVLIATDVASRGLDIVDITLDS